MADHRKCLHPAPTCSLFDFQIAPRGGLWEAALHLFYSALKSGAQQRLPLRGGSEKLWRVFISDCVGGGGGAGGLLYLCPAGRQFQRKYCTM